MTSTGQMEHLIEELIEHHESVTSPTELSGKQLTEGEAEDPAKLA